MTRHARCIGNKAKIRRGFIGGWAAKNLLVALLATGVAGCGAEIPALLFAAFFFDAITNPVQNGQPIDDGGIVVPNEAPSIADDAATTTEDTPVAIDVLSNDADPDGALDPSTVSVTAGPAHGATQIDPLTGVITYTPIADYNGGDAIIYEVCDNDATPLCATGTLTLTITPANDAPGTSPDTGAVTEDAISSTATGNVLTNDSDTDGDSLSISEVAGSAANVANSVAGTYGDVTINADGTYTYTLNNGLSAVQALSAGQNAPDAFDYTADDGTDTASSTLTVAVTGANDPTTAVDDADSVTEDGPPATGDVSANDTDIDANDILNVTQLAGSSANVGTPFAGTYGSITLNADGTYTYTVDNANSIVNALAVGGSLSDPFAYTIGDGTTTDTATLTITIDGANDAPVGVSDTNSITEDAAPGNVSGNVLPNDTDVDTAAVLAVSQVSGLPGNVGNPVAGSNGYGSATIDANGTYTYNLGNGLPAVQALAQGQFVTDQITYTVSDGGASDDTTLTITVNGANDAPVAVSDSAYTVTNGLTININAASGVLANDTDVDTTDTRTAVLDVGPTKATSFTLNPNGSFDYSHDGSGPGSDTFTYHALDNNGASSNIATVTISVQTGPAANDDTYEATFNSALNINAANGVIQGGAPGAVADTGTPTPTITHYGPVGGPLTTTPGNVYTTVNNGLLTMSANGSFSYTPATGFSGADQFDYEISNAVGTDTATVTVNVNEVPTANNDNPGAAYTVLLGNTLTINTGANDLLANDDRGFPLATIVSFGPSTGNETVAGNAGSTSGGTGLTVNANGSFTYTPVDSGSHTFVYKLQNATGSDTATVTITVNEGPTANDDNPGLAYTVLLGNTLTINAGGTDLLANDDRGFPLATIVSFGPTTGNETAAGSPGSTSAGTGLTVNANGSFSYTPVATGVHTFVYKLQNSIGSDTATVVVQVAKPPIANNDNPGALYTLLLGGTLTRPAADLFNDHGAGADDLGFPLATIVSFGPSTGDETAAGVAGSTSGGTGLTVNGDGGFTYTPVTNGVHTFVYRLSNGVNPSDTATVTITVNGPPVAANDPTGGIPSNSSPGTPPYHIAMNGSISGSLNLTSNDDVGFPLAAVDKFGPTTGLETNAGAAGVSSGGGTLTVFANGTFNYTPPSATFTGLDSFKYQITNAGGSSIATVSLAVGIRPATTNDSHAVTGNIDIDTSTGTPSSVLTNDTGDQLTASLVGDTNGTATVAASGTYTFNPDAGFTGAATITYNATNGFGSVTGTVNLTVANMVWFVDNALGSNGDGRLSSPFNVLASADTASPSGVTYVFRNTGTNYATGYTLAASERLLGESIAFNDANLGITIAPHSANLPALGTSPTLTGTVTLANSSVVRGINISTTAGATALAGSSATSVTVDTVATVLSSGGTAVSLNASTGTVTLGAVTSNNSATTGVSLTSISGALTFAVTGATNITNPTGVAIDISAVSSAAASIRFGTDTNGTTSTGTTTINTRHTHGISINNADNTTGDIRFGNTTIGAAAGGASGNGVNIVNGTAADVGFIDLDINHAAANLSGIVATDMSGTLTTTSGTINTGSATAINIDGPGGLTPLAMTLTSVSASGAADGILLTETSGNFTVAGDGTGHANGSGGSISNATSHAATLTTVSGTLSLNSMNFSMNTSAIYGILFDNNAGGTVTGNFTGCTFTGVTASVSQNKSLLQYEAGGSANVTANVQNTFFNSSRTYGLFTTGAGTSVMNVTVNQCGFGTDVNAGAPVNQPGTTITNPPAFSLGITNGSSAQVDYSVTNNTFWGADGLLGAIYAVTISGASTTATSHLNGFFNDNKIGKTGVTGSGCSNGCAGLGLLPGVDGTFNASVSNNDIRQVNAQGINLFNSVTAAAGTSIGHFTNNTIAEPDTTGSPAFQRALVVSAGNSGGSTANWCTEITGNAISGAWQASNFIRITTLNTTGILTIPGLTPPSGATGAQVDTYIEGLNTVGAGNCNTTVGGAINDGAACATP